MEKIRKMKVRDEIRKGLKSRLDTYRNNVFHIEITDIAIEEISLHKNIRNEYTELEELKSSIKESGLVHPILVYPTRAGYIVKTGHRRFKALEQLHQQYPDKYGKIRCIVSAERNSVLVDLIEGIQRSNLSQIELAVILGAMRKEGVLLKDIAEIMGKSEGHVKNLFTGVNAISKDAQLEELVRKRNVSILDVAETNGIRNQKKRAKLLAAHCSGMINREELRQEIQKEKQKQRKALSTPLSGKEEESSPSVKITVGDDGLNIKLLFNRRDTAQLMITSIKRLLARHEIQAVW